MLFRSEPAADALLDEDEIPTPPPPASEPQEAAEDEPAAELEETSTGEEVVEETTTEQPAEEPQSRLVQQDCSQCQQRFEVTLPEGHDVARTACPSCGAIETVSLN